MERGNEAAVGELLHRRGWRKAFTIAEMAGNWAWLVKEVEHGYTDMVEEYLNDLYCRNWLHEAWPLLDDRSIDAWSARIETLDDRFKRATDHDDGRALSQFARLPDDPGMWWWRRRPRVLAGELGESLRSAGVADTPA